jgi:hypothetical protein
MIRQTAHSLTKTVRGHDAVLTLRQLDLITDDIAERMHIVLEERETEIVNTLRETL